MNNTGRGLLSFLKADVTDEEQKLMSELDAIRHAQDALYDLDDLD